MDTRGYIFTNAEYDDNGIITNLKRTLTEEESKADYLNAIKEGRKCARFSHGFLLGKVLNIGDHV